MAFDCVGVLTITCALADLLGSAALTALTVTVVEVVTLGAVYIPAAEILPAVAVHVTLALLVPVMVAVNCAVALATSPAELGEIDTEIVVAVGAGADALCASAAPPAAPQPVKLIANIAIRDIAQALSLRNILVPFEGTKISHGAEVQ